MKNEPKSLKSVKEAFDAKRFDQTFPKFDAKKEKIAQSRESARALLSLQPLTTQLPEILALSFPES